MTSKSTSIHHRQSFQTRKQQTLSKRDKSSAGRIDPHAVSICAALNDRVEFYTTSSCSGRCFLYVGRGIKSWHHGDGEGFFRRFRVSHGRVGDARRYFDLRTLLEDGTGGGDPLPGVGQFENFGNNVGFRERLEMESSMVHVIETPVWLRYEPFILHVMCRSLGAASKLMALARPSFKNVGLTSWNARGASDDDDDTMDGADADADAEHVNPSVHRKVAAKNQQCKGGGPRYLIAIWGDEGLDMPLSLPSSPTRGIFYDSDDEARGLDTAEWLAQLVNERHVRNWNKIDRFVEAVRGLDDTREVDVDYDHDRTTGESAEIGMDDCYDEEDDIDRTYNVSYQDRAHADNNANAARVSSGLPIPRSYDVIGDVAVLNALPEGDEEVQRRVGEWIMNQNNAIKICVARTGSLSTTHRSPGENGILQLAGPPRNPIVTSHCEYGIKCVVDLQHTFFSPRMAPERLRLSQQVARGERVLVVFAGVGMEALLVAARTEACEVLAVEKNGVAAECLRRARRMLERNKTAICPGSGMGAAERLRIIEGDALDVLPTLEKEYYDRIVAPRPKEGAMDGDLGDGDVGLDFLLAMLPLLKSKGEMHWYDFAADHELPRCNRTRTTLECACRTLGLGMEVIHVAKVGSVAKRQWRVCVDFKIIR